MRDPLDDAENEDDDEDDEDTDGDDEDITLSLDEDSNEDDEDSNEAVLPHVVTQALPAAFHPCQNPYGTDQCATTPNGVHMY